MLIVQVHKHYGYVLCYIQLLEKESENTDLNEKSRFQSNFDIKVKEMKELSSEIKLITVSHQELKQEVNFIDM